MRQSRRSPGGTSYRGVSQKLRVPSPLRPHTTMAIEKVKTAARAAQPTVISMVCAKAVGGTVASGAGQTGALVIDCRAMPPVRSRIRCSAASPGGQTVLDRQQLRAPYPNGRVIVLDDDHNTFQHVVEALVRHIPGMQPDRAWELAHRIDGTGSAEVWCGPLEQAELYHQQLAAEGLTMAPLERG